MRLYQYYRELDENNNYKENVEFYGLEPCATLYPELANYFINSYENVDGVTSTGWYCPSKTDLVVLNDPSVSSYGASFGFGVNNCTSVKSYLNQTTENCITDETELLDM